MAEQDLTYQFTESQRRINLTERVAIAQAAHLEVRAVLADDTVLNEHGLDDVLIGSYARNTAIWPGACSSRSLLRYVMKAEASWTCTGSSSGTAPSGTGTNP